MRQLEQGTVSTEILAQIRQWMEHVSVALGDPGVHGLNMTAMRQASTHLVELRKLMDATSTAYPDDRPSAWPEGEGIDPGHPRIDYEGT